MEKVKQFTGCQKQLFKKVLICIDEKSTLNLTETNRVYCSLSGQGLTNTNSFLSPLGGGRRDLCQGFYLLKTEFKNQLYVF